MKMVRELAALKLSHRESSGHEHTMHAHTRNGEKTPLYIARLREWPNDANEVWP